MSEKSSRLVVKCLGKHVTEDQLKKLFAAEGTITDLQLKYKKNGNFRHFAFVGFKTVDEAEHAKNTLDNTYFGSSKIVVEFCNSVKKNIDDKNDGKVEGIPQNKVGKKSKKGAEKKNKKDSTAEKNKDTNNQGTEIDKDIDSYEEIENDPDFQEFIGTHRNVKAKKSQVWQNDDLQPSVEKKVSKKKENQHDETQESASKPAKQSVKGTFRNTIKLKGIPEEKRNRKDIKTFLDPLKPISLRMPRKVKSIAYAAFRTQEEVEQALSKHRNFMWGTLITVLKYEPKEEEQVDPKYAHQKQLSEDDTKSVLVDTGRIFIRNLCYSCTEENIEELFKPFGPIAEIHLPIDKITKKIKGFGFVSFVFPEHALRAFNDLDGTIFQGRMLHLIPGEAKPEEKVHLLAKSSFKKRKELEEKKTVGVGHNWNALFLGINALSEVISEKYDVKKSQLLMEGKPNESIAARVALGETQIVNEIKDFLVSNGVRLDSFDNDKPIRSKTIILVKNLPAKTTQSELEELFSRYGSVSRTILPPSAITAIVEMENSVDAKKVFKKLSYKNFKTNPLYLEWAPMDVFSLDSLPTQSVEAEGGDQTSANSLTDIRKNMASERTILVKNLSLQTSDESLKEHFSQCGKVVNVCLMSRKTADGQSKSLGYGFVEFENLKGTEKAMRKLQNSILDGSSLQLKQSKAKADDPATIVLRKPTNVTEQISSKIAVRNIPFEATEKDIEQLFSVFGKIKSLRLPKKVTGNHRGFGFVDFLVKEDAKRAFDSLSLSTHLLGRRLVLEWSKDDEDNQNVPKRGRYFDDESNSRKKLKKSQLLDDLERSGPVLKMDLE